MANQPLKIIQNSQKQMPCNIEAEQALIGSILVSNDLYDEITLIVDSQKFFDPIHIKIFETIENLISKGLLANPITLKNFFENNEDCPTCEQHIDEIFKSGMVEVKSKEVIRFSDALEEMETALTVTKKRQEVISALNDEIRVNEVNIAKENSSVVELEKFNTRLSTEIEHLQSYDVNKADYDKLGELKTMALNLTSRKSKLREDQTYGDAARNMLQDTGIKTKIIKQYLPIMNKLINTYLSTMEFFVNFTLDESFEETIKSRYRDEFSYASFSEGEKMRIDLALLFTWRMVAKLKNSVNTNLLILDEVFDSSLDAEGTDAFLKIINTLDADTNVFVISHKGEILFDKFISTIKFVKEKQFSRIETT